MIFQQVNAKEMGFLNRKPISLAFTCYLRALLHEIIVLVKLDYTAAQARAKSGEACFQGYLLPFSLKTYICKVGVARGYVFCVFLLQDEISLLYASGGPSGSRLIFLWVA